MANEGVDTGIVHLDGIDGYIKWPLPLPDKLFPVDIAVESPEEFYELQPGDVVAHYDYDDDKDVYIRRT